MSTTNKPENPPAFPVFPETGFAHAAAYRGMTLRDWFAGQALVGMLAHSRNGHGYRPADPNQHWHLAITEEAYQIAGAMLAEREKGASA